MEMIVSDAPPCPARWRSTLLDIGAGGKGDIVTDHGAALDLGAGSDDHADFGPTRCFASLLLYR